MPLRQKDAGFSFQYLKYHPNFAYTKTPTLLIFSYATIYLKLLSPIALTIFSLKSVCWVSPVYKILNKWARMQESSAPLYFSASSRYSKASRSRSIICPQNRAGFSRRASALITPSTLVSARHLFTSLNKQIPPFAITGMLTIYFIFFMMAQSHSPTLSLFCSLVRPCTVSNLQPAPSIFLTNSIVFSSDFTLLILQKMGTLMFFDSELTIFQTRSGSSSRKEPQCPFLAIPWGQPKLTSMASTSFSSIFAAFTIISGSFPQI